MACRYTYKGKTYEAWEFEDVLMAMSPTEASAFMPSVKAIPEAPFVQTTDAVLNLALKRVITMAVDGGYDKVAFVNGQQSTDRYWGHEAVRPAIERWNAVSKPEGIRELGENVLGRKMYPLVPLDHMDTGVLPMLKHDQVVDAVVSRIPVDVVNVLARHGLTAEQLARNGDVVFDALTVDDRSRAASALGAAIGQTGATIRAKLEVLGSTRADVQLLPALRASDLDSREVLGVVSPGTIFHGIGGSLPKESAAARTIAEPASGKQGRRVEQKLGTAEIAELLNGHVEAKYGREGLLQHSVEPPPGLGMKAFYDTIVPNAVKALVKRLGGGHLEEVSINAGVNTDTSEIRWSEDTDGIQTIEWDGGERQFDTEDEARTFRDSLISNRTTQPGFTITPAMREKVADGLPSFSRANGGFDLPEESVAQNLRRKAQDFFLRAQVVQEAISKQGGNVDERTDFYRAEELSHGRMGSLLQDFANNQVQPLMEKLVKMGIDLDELSLYAYAKHAPERNRQIAKINKAMPDGGSGMTNAEAAGILQLVDLSGDKAKFEELHADLMAITSTNRLAMLADGLITQEEFSALEGQYENYIPLRGFEVMEDGEKPAGRPAGRGFNVHGKETLRALGRRTRAGQLIENVIGDYQRTVVRGERNHVAKVFLNFVLQNPDPDLWEIEAQRTRLALDRQTGRVVKNTLIDKGEDTISVKVAGQEIYIKIKDPLLLRAMRKQHASDMGEQHRVLVSALGLYTNLLRNTLTRYNPEFALVNAMRDVGFGALAAFDEMGAGGLARYMGNYAGATAASFRAERNAADPQGNRWDRTLSEYKAAGGATSGFYAKDLEGISSDIRGMMIEAGAAPNGWAERARHNIVTKQVARFGRVLEFAGSVSENAARVAAYKTARDMGKSPSQAASIAKNLTTNFDRKGEWGATLNAAYVFFNAAVQGSHRTLKMFANPKVSGVLLGTAVAGVQLALYAAAAGGDDPDDGIAYWDKIPAHVKERNLIIMLPPGAVMDGAEQVGTNGRYISIPIQYGLNIFPLLGYQIADVLRNQKDKTRGVTVQKAAIAMASAIAGSFNPLGGAVDLTSGSSVMQAVAPSIFDPVIQGATGTNAFGREVAPFKSPFDTKPDSQNSNVRQAGGPAEAVARWINSVSGGSEYESGAIDLSPGTVENVVRNLTGGTGMFLYDVVALAGKQIDEFNGEAPERFTKDIPVWRRVRGDIDGDVDQGIFYENRRKIQEARGIQKRMEDSGDDVELTGEKAELAGMDKSANKTTLALSKIRKQIAEIKRDADISDTERAVRIRELQAERDALVNEFNRDFMETMREYFEASSGVNQ